MILETTLVMTAEVGRYPKEEHLNVQIVLLVFINQKLELERVDLANRVLGVIKQEVHLRQIVTLVKKAPTPQRLVLLLLQRAMHVHQGRKV